MVEKYVLLVEGPDDAHVFYHLSRHHQIHERFVIKSKEGINQLLDTLDVELLRSDLERLGIVVDADTDLEARWRALQNILLRSGYAEAPTIPHPTGTIIEQAGHPMIGIWLMPDNTLPGMLEHFIGFLVPKEDRLWKRAQQCVEQIPEQDRLFPASHQIKAYLHTWLAWQSEPGKPLGQAITKQYFDAEAPRALQLVGWLRRLFDLG